MNKFRFKLRSLLRYREILEEGKKKELGIALNELKKQEDIAGSISSRISEHNQYTENLAGGKTTIQKLRESTNYSRFLKKEKENQENVIANVSVIVDEKRNKYLESKKDKMVIEKLREKEKAEYDLQSNKEEQSVIDDLANLKRK